MTEMAGHETPEQALESEREPAPADEPSEGWRFEGFADRTYPGFIDPRTGYTLVVGPGEVVNSAEWIPPDDGLWYDVSSGQPYQASTGAGKTEE